MREKTSAPAPPADPTLVSGRRTRWRPPWASPAAMPSRKSRWRRLVVRRLLGAALVGGAALLALGVVAPAPVPEHQVLAAARDLPSGTVLTASDVSRISIPDAALRGHPLSDGDWEGARLASGLDAGEILTESRLVPRRSGIDLPAGTSAVHVIAADSAALALLHPGESVRVFPPGGGDPVGPSSLIVSIDPPETARPLSPGAASTRGLVLALTSAQVEALLRSHSTETGLGPPPLTAYLVGDPP